MPAAKRNVDAGEVTHAAISGLKVLIQFDKKEQIFHATYAGVYYQHEIMREVSKLVYEDIERSLHVPWQSVIQVKPLLPYMASMVDEQFIGFRIERLWIAKFPDGSYKQCQWNAQERNMFLSWCKPFFWDEEKCGLFLPPKKVKSYSDVYYYLPYSEELWLKLEFLQMKIKELRSQLIALFEGVDGIELLLSLPLHNLLALPEPAEKVIESR